MKVLVVTASVSRTGGGVSEAARLLALALAENPAMSVEVVTLRDEHLEADEPAWQGIPIRAHRFFGPSNFGLSPALFADVLRSPADIVHVHGIWMFHCFAVLARFLKKRTPYVLTPHGMMERWIRSRSRWMKEAVSRLYQDAFLKRVATFHVLTEKELVDVEEMTPGKPARIIPNYVVPARAAEGKPAWWRPEMEGRDIYMFFGRLHEKKGCLELASAWDELCAADPEFRDRSVLVFCGWLDGMGGFAEEIAALNRNYGNITYAGPQFAEEKPRSFGAATFFVLPSKSEGLPMAVLESWAAGLPVLMTRECNLPEGFAAGAALEIGADTASIRDGLKRASMLSAEERSRMAEAGRGLIAGKFSAGAVGGAMIDLYREVLAKGGAR